MRYTITIDPVPNSYINVLIGREIIMDDGSANFNSSIKSPYPYWTRSDSFHMITDGVHCFSCYHNKYIPLQ